MDERFGEWLRDTLADVDDDILKRRWSAVESLASDLDEFAILDLLLHTTICPPQNGESIQKARKAFWEHDNAFRMEGNELELHRLCGAVVIHSLSIADSPQRMRTALACVCLHLGAPQHGFGWPAMCEEAEGVLRSLAISVRSSDANHRTPPDIIPQNKTLARFKKLINDGNDQLPINDLHEFLTQSHEDLKQVAADNRAMRSALSIQKEETDILWWLMGGCSNDLDRPFHQLHRAVAALVAGKELADHVVHRPGPLSAEAILNRAIQKTEDPDQPISLAAALKMLPTAWKKDLAADVDDQALPYCPLLAAISYSVSVDDEPTWATLFSKHFPHPPELEVAPAVLALHIYRERTLSLDLNARR